MGISDVVDNLRSLKKTVKKPITAIRETVHNAYTKAYVGSPERVDEFYNYIKVYVPSKHNDLCMMSITADINRFSMIPDKNTFFHVLKLEKHFDRMIAARKEADVNGDMAIQILSGHNATFMSKYRRYKNRSAAKELKRRNQRFKALNVRRHTQLPDSGSDDSCVYGNRTSLEMPVSMGEEMLSREEPLQTIAKTVATTEVVETKNPPVILKKSVELEEIPHKKKDVTIHCELTKPETVVAAPVPAQNVSAAAVPVKEDDSLAVSAARASIIQKKIHMKNAEKACMFTVKKHDAKFKVAKSVAVKKEKVERAEGMKPLDKKKVEVEVDSDVDEDAEDCLAEIVKNLTLAGTPAAKVQPKIVVEQDSDSEDHDEFDKCDSEEDSDDGSDIEELEKIEDKDLDALEYEMI